MLGKACCGREAVYANSVSDGLFCKLHAVSYQFRLYEKRKRLLRNLGANFMQVGLYLALSELESYYDGWEITYTIREVYSHSK